MASQTQGILGEKLGLYKAMADGAPVTAAQLAAKTGTHERYVSSRAVFREPLCSSSLSNCRACLPPRPCVLTTLMQPLPAPDLSERIN